MARNGPPRSRPGARERRQGDESKQADRLALEIESPRSRLAGLSRASLRVTEDLGLDAALREIADEARSLTGARYAVIATLDESGQAEAFTASGLNTGDARRLREIPAGLRFFEYLGAMPRLLRDADFAAHASSMGLPEFLPPMPMSALPSATAAPPRATSTWPRAHPASSSAARTR